jgi:hypothetical protein
MALCLLSVCRMLTNVGLVVDRWRVGWRRRAGGVFSGSLAILLCVVASGCDDDAPDGDGLVIEQLDQPTSQGLGILLALHARGGNAIDVAVDDGMFLAAGAGSDATVPATTACLPNSTSTEVFTFELAVTPTQQQALLSATLYTNADCTGAAIQSRLAIVQQPTLVPIVDAGVGDAP